MAGTSRPAAAAATDELLYPEYWLVSGLEWRGDRPTAEAAAAVAPGLIPRAALSHHVLQVVGCADLYVRKHGHRVIFFSDLTRMFANAGTSWSRLGVDWERGLRELHDGSFPAVFLTISERAYHCICAPVGRSPAFTNSGAGHATDEDRELVRQAITHQLVTDWPPYMRTIIDAGHVHVAR